MSCHEKMRGIQMDGYQITRYRDTTKAFWFLAGLVLIGAVVAGVLLRDSELFSPSLHEAKADKLRAETEVLRVQTAYEQRQREIELRLAEEKAAIELQALRDRRTREMEFWELAASVGLVVGSVVVITLVIAALYYVVVKARILMQGSAAEATRHSDQIGLSSGSESRQRSPKKYNQSSHFVQGFGVGPSRANYDRFLDFCRAPILSNGYQPLPQDCSQWNYWESSPSSEISLDEAQTYISVLQQARIIKLGTNGCNGWVLDKRISSINDIQRRIPHEAFDKVT
jgi:hypothetical protein